MTARLLSTAPTGNSNVMLFKRILFVENDPQIATDVRDALDLHFYDVTVVPNGPTAVRALLHEEFDAILCDATIPCFPAEMFFQAVKQIKPQLCKRFISITNSSQSRKNGRPLGTLSIWKPIDIPILMEAMETVLRKHQPAIEKLPSTLASAAA